MIRTKTTKQVEYMAFEKLSDMSVIMGAVKTLYKRHKHGFQLVECFVVAFVCGLVIGRSL